MKEEVFKIEKGSVVCITGSGGKTSLMYFLAERLSKRGRVAVTTTTKIYRPDRGRYENLIIGDERYGGRNKGIDVLGGGVLGAKITGLTYMEIEALKEEYDYILVEGDGARERILKGWNEGEPCIPPGAQIVIGVVNIKSLGMAAGKESVHRLELFLEATGSQVGDRIDTEVLRRYIETGGFFKGSCGRNIIFINGVEDEGEIIAAMRSTGDREYYLGSIRDAWIERVKKIDAVIMASGYSRRFGGDKLLEKLEGIPLVEHLMKKLKNLPFNRVMVVGRTEEMRETAERYGYEYIENRDAHLGQSESVKIGAEAMTGDAVMYFTGDQAALEERSIARLMEAYEREGEITRPVVSGRPSSPVIFPARYRKELMKLEGDSGGREVIKNAQRITLVDFENPNEFEDVDTQEDLERVKKGWKDSRWHENC